MATFEKDRKRRIIYNDDSDQQYEGYEGYKYVITDEQSFIDARTTPTFDTHVDTYSWCVGNGCEPPWKGTSRLRACLGSYEHVNDVIVEACHAKGMEVWASLRMNDIHDSFMANCYEETNDPLKAEHPEYLIEPEKSRSLTNDVTERFLWSAFNFARPEVREYRLNYIRKNAAAHDFDGYELDFSRFVWNFPLGEDRRDAPLMTQLIRDVRKSLSKIGKKRKRPYTFAVHVMDSPRTSLELGQDVETWLAEGLVDVIVMGMGYMPYVMPVAQWVELGKRYGVPVYPSVNTNTYGTGWEKLHGRPMLHEAVRASSAYYWQQGADGLYLFNLFCAEDRTIGAWPRDYIYAPLKEIGDPKLMVGNDKLYTIQPSADSGFCHHGSEMTPLPVSLDSTEHKLPLQMGPDAEDANAKVRVRALTSGGKEDAKVYFRLNHKLLQVQRRGEWCEAHVPAGVTRPGFNELSIWCSAEPDQRGNPIVVHRLFVPVTYG